MLTGLLFAIEEAADDPAQLIAALPFAGATVIEHQARHLIAAGAGQIVVLGERRSPELIGALHRIGRRGIPVDEAGCAAEAAATLHPLARVVMLADGLVTTETVVRSLAAEGGDALLVIPGEDAPAGFERIGGASAWAGVARIEPQRVADLAQLPADYDPQATLVRLAEAAGAAHLPLPLGALRDGHGVERDAASLGVRGQQLVAAAVATPRDWFDRFLAAPLARVAMPLLVARGIETTTLAGAGVVLTIAGEVALSMDWPRAGMLLVIAAILMAGVGQGLARLRDEPGLQRGVRIGVRVVAAVAMLALGWRCSAIAADGTALILAVAVIAATTLIDRAGVAPALWWGGAASCALVVAAATWLGAPAAGLATAAAYAVATLAAAVERLRGLARL